MATRSAKKSPRKSPSGAPLRGVAVDPSLRGRGPTKGAPNAGRPKQALREKMCAALEERIPVALAIADGEPVQRVRLPNGDESETRVSASPGDRLRALEFLAKFGLGTTITETDAEGNNAPPGRLTRDEMRDEVRRILAERN